MRVLDLFSGIGGFSLGLERAGMETVAFCEIDKHCQKVLKKHWPEVPIFEDVTALTKEQLPKDIDVICGGFPCQDISVAGQKKGFLDEQGNRTRSGLWEEYKRIIEEVKPRYVIIENVANLRVIGLASVLKDLWEIGYGCEWHIISARSVGACHLRERIWIIAYPHSYTLWDEQGWSGWEDRKSSGILGDNGERGTTADSNLPRLWRSFTSEEAAQRWWTKATSSFRDWWKVESDFCRMDDGISRGLDERGRKERVKQLGNAVVPQIPEIIGKAILDREAKNIL